MRDARVSSPSLAAPVSDVMLRGSLPQREELAMSLLADILGGGTQSRLYKNSRSKRRSPPMPAPGSTATCWTTAPSASMPHPMPASTIEDVEKGIDADTGRCPRPRALPRKNSTAAATASSPSATYLLDSQDTLARIFGRALTTGQSIDDIMNWERDIAQVTVEDVNKAARTVFDPRPRSRAFCCPKPKSSKAETEP